MWPPVRHKLFLPIRDLPKNGASATLPNGYYLFLLVIAHVYVLETSPKTVHQSHGLVEIRNRVKTMILTQ